MKTILLTVTTISVFGLGMLGCTASFSTNNATANTAKANTATTNTANKETTSNAPKKDGATKPALTNEKKPEGTSKKAKENPVPDNWLYIYDETKGYGFYVPEGTTGGSDSADGVDTFVATTPAPSEVSIFVIAFKDKEMTKEDLLDVGVKFLEEMGETVTAGKLTGESEQYSVAELLSTRSDGIKSKGKILVGTDITDNYVMILGTDESKYAANEKIIDEIWGSFEMWSGGGVSGT